MNIYCDGACQPNPGEMGIGVFIPETNLSYSAYFGRGTNQQAELIALIRAIELSSRGDIIYTDSKYALGMASGWKAKANTEIVFKLRETLKAKSVSLRWVRGHNGHNAQEMADSLAQEAAEKRAGKRIDQPSHSEQGKAPVVLVKALEPVPVAAEIPFPSECEPEAWGNLCE